MAGLESIGVSTWRSASVQELFREQLPVIHSAKSFEYLLCARPVLGVGETAVNNADTSLILEQLILQEMR